MKKLFRSTLALAVGLSLAACNSSDKDVDPIVTPPVVTPTTLDFQGTAVKGVLSNATVNIYAASDTEFTTILATTQTDATGNYTVTVTDASGEPIVGAFIIQVVADEDTTMVCDALACDGVEKGETIPASELTDLTLSTFSYSDGTAAIDADVNTLTTMATDAIQAAAASNTDLDLGDVTLEDVVLLQESASEVVGAILGVDLSETNIYDVEIVDASVSANVSTDNAIAATLTLINASLAGLDSAEGETLSDAINSYIEAVEEVTTVVFAADDPTTVDIGAEATEALVVINETQAQIATEIENLVADIVMDTGVELVVEEVPTEVDTTEITETIGEVVVVTGGTGS